MQLLFVQKFFFFFAVGKCSEPVDNCCVCLLRLQVLTILHEVFPAVKAAEMAVKFRPLWWEGWQTLGRAQLNLGEVDMVRKPFTRCSPDGWNQKLSLNCWETFCKS